MHSIPFVKMQGLGNDFVVIEEKDLDDLSLDYSKLAQKMCNRSFGIGADGLIISVAPEHCPETDIGWKFYNADGTIAEMCGNGMRCFAKYVYEKNLVPSNKFTVATLAGTIIPEILDNGQIKVNMGMPIFDPEKIPANCLKEPVINQRISVNGKEFKFNAISMGNPHCIIFTDDSTEDLALEYGKDLEHHKVFPKKTNVEFVEILSKKKIQVDVWERGCGITQACGTGACASVVAAILNNLTENEVEVVLPGGSLKVKWDGTLSNLSKDVFMIGPAEFVFFGDFLL